MYVIYVCTHDISSLLICWCCVWCCCRRASSRNALHFHLSISLFVFQCDGLLLNRSFFFTRRSLSLLNHYSTAFRVFIIFAVLFYLFKYCNIFYFVYFVLQIIPIAIQKNLKKRKRILMIKYRTQT